MKLIADSGSTKTDWVLTENGKRIASAKTQGLNPYFQTTEEIVAILQNELAPQISNKSPQEVFFYGAGCTFPEKRQLLHNAFLKVWQSTTNIHLQSDLVGSAIALCGNNEGIACILGTGSNSCYWNGEKIVKNVPPLGYILGDEGSGAVLGKLFIADLLKGQLSQELSAKFFQQYHTNYEEIINKVYKEKLPNRSLAQYAYFLLENIEDKQIQTIVKQSFDSFIKRNILHYPTHLKIHFVGSIAVAFESILRETLLEHRLQIGQILQKPIDALVKYHSF
ncbi:MAG: hypothetical protein KGV44_11010 [Flavobacteriaceae bacterium]|nr:hypothetical protein [Flavobacteriaceae bacterium]